jgi:hypothetical protein
MSYTETRPLEVTITLPLPPRLLNILNGLIQELEIQSESEDPYVQDLRLFWQQILSELSEVVNIHPPSNA